MHGSRWVYGDIERTHSKLTFKSTQREFREILMNVAKHARHARYVRHARHAPYVGFD